MSSIRYTYKCGGANSEFRGPPTSSQDNEDILFGWTVTCSLLTAHTSEIKPCACFFRPCEARKCLVLRGKNDILF
jgi:hypothetical protein